MSENKMMSSTTKKINVGSWISGCVASRGMTIVRISMQKYNFLLRYVLFSYFFCNFAAKFRY